MKTVLDLKKYFIGDRKKVKGECDKMTFVPLIHINPITYN